MCILTHVETRRGEFDIALAIGIIVVPCRYSVLRRAFAEGLQTVVFGPAELALGTGLVRVAASKVSVGIPHNVVAATIVGILDLRHGVWIVWIGIVEIVIVFDMVRTL